MSDSEASACAGEVNERVELCQIVLRLRRMGNIAAREKCGELYAIQLSACEEIGNAGVFLGELCVHRVFVKVKRNNLNDETPSKLVRVEHTRRRMLYYNRNADELWREERLSKFSRSRVLSLRCRDVMDMADWLNDI